MDCRRAEELLSDDLGAALAPPLRLAFEDHLSGCAQCRELRRMLPQVVEALRELGRGEMQLPAGLVERVAARSFVSPAKRRTALRARTPSAAWQAAAVFLAAVSMWMMSGSLSPASTRRLTTRFVERSANTGAYVLERKDRLVEELRFLDVAWGTAFEEGLDRMGARVQDYRKLLLGKRETPAPDGRSGSFSNPSVRRCVRLDDGAAEVRIWAHRTRSFGNLDRPLDRRQGART